MRCARPMGPASAGFESSAAVVGPASAGFESSAAVVGPASAGRCNPLNAAPTGYRHERDRDHRRNDARGPRFAAPPPLALYVHIPWCLRKCPYCDFNSHEARGGAPEAAYVDALLADLEFALPRSGAAG